MTHAGTESLAARRSHAALAKVHLLAASPMSSGGGGAGYVTVTGEHSSRAAEGEGQKQTGVGGGARKDSEPNGGDGGSARIALTEDHLDQTATVLRVMSRGGGVCLDELD